MVTLCCLPNGDKSKVPDNICIPSTSMPMHSVRSSLPCNLHTWLDSIVIMHLSRVFCYSNVLWFRRLLLDQKEGTLILGWRQGGDFFSSSSQSLNIEPLQVMWYILAQKSKVTGLVFLRTSDVMYFEYKNVSRQNRRWVTVQCKFRIFTKSNRWKRNVKEKLPDSNRH